MRQPIQELIQCYQNNLYAVAFNVCKNQMDAEDVVQDAFIQYYTSKKEFEDKQHIRAWLIRIVINKAKNINRTFWRKNKCSLEDYMGTLTKEELNSPDIEYKNDGTVWLYYQDQKIDITDKFDGDICYVKIDAGKKTLYVTVKRNNGFACSEDKYISPDEFN